MYTTNEHRMQIYAGKLILFFGESTFLTKKTEGALHNAGIISLGPVETVGQALKALESGNIDAVILDVALNANLIIPVIARLDEKAVPFVFAAPSSRKGQIPAGFVLSGRESDLLKIGNVLFPPPPNNAASIH